MKALVIFSGGQDSTTCLGIARKQYKEVQAINFNYGQNHVVEIYKAREICDDWGIKLTEVNIGFLNQIVDSALTSQGNVNESHPRLQHLPASFVPNRNALFIALAHAFAQKIGYNVLITGVCQTDYSGYPDCRRLFIDSIEHSLNLGSDSNIMIKTPLMFLNKAQTFQMAADNGILDIVLEMSHTCYNGNHSFRHEWGYGCGECPACIIRSKGYAEYKNISK